MQYQDFIAQVRTRGGFDDSAYAEEAARSTLMVLGERLAGGEPHNLASQLPGELQPLLSQHTGQADDFNVEEFVRRVSDREGRDCSESDAREHAQAVLSTLAGAVSGGELDDVRSQLPSGYDSLFQS